MSGVKHPAAFEAVVASVIVANTGLLVWSAFDHAHEELLGAVETGCLVFFCVELAVRLRSMGWQGFKRSKWCWFDTVVIGLSLLPMLGMDVSLLRTLRIARFARLIHVGRHVSHLRLLRLLGIAEWAAVRGYDWWLIDTVHHGLMKLGLAES